MEVAHNWRVRALDIIVGTSAKYKSSAVIGMRLESTTAILLIASALVEDFMLSSVWIFTVSSKHVINRNLCSAP